MWTFENIKRLYTISCYRDYILSHRNHERTRKLITRELCYSNTPHIRNIHTASMLNRRNKNQCSHIHTFIYTHNNETSLKNRKFVRKSVKLFITPIRRLKPSENNKMKKEPSLLLLLFFRLLCYSAQQAFV